MHFANALERMHAFVERFDKRRLDRRRQMDNVPEPFIRNSDDCRMVAGQLAKDAIEALEIDRLAADFDEIAGAAFHANRSSAHIAEVFGDEPTADFRIDETFFGGVAGEK